MKRLLTFLLVLGLVTPSWAAWDKTKPADNEKLVDTPALIRANWQAIETGTDANLQITNAKVAAAAGIVDTKLATISTAGKVSGTAITGLASLPAGAGATPIANGGTGQTTATAAATALLPTQTGNSGKSLVTNGTVQSWGYPAGLSIASEAQGDVLIRDGSAWTRLGAGSAGQVLKTQGAGANAIWGYPAGLAIASEAQGDILYYNGSAWVRLGAGTSGQYLKTQGAGANPLWADVSSVTQVNDTDGGTAYTSETTFLSVSKTITSGKTVMLIASGYCTHNNSGNTSQSTFRLKHSSTTVGTTVLKQNDGTKHTGPWSLCAIVTGLSGSTTFSVTATIDVGNNGTAYGNLIVIEF